LSRGSVGFPMKNVNHPVSNPREGLTVHIVPAVTARFLLSPAANGEISA
jgi:hypothetical protein